MRTVIVNAIVVTMNQKGEIYNPGFVMFEDDVITMTGEMKDLEGNAAFRMQHDWMPETQS